jgi:micrococcal nuclease
VFVVDGDTLDVLVASVEERLRLIGINSPESGECFAAEASERLAEIVAGGLVTLVRDQSDRDQYGRLLRYVYVGEEFVNETLVREGLAIARRYEPDTAMASILEAAQDEAIAAGSGLWAPAACGAPAESDIQIGQIRYDADGDDNTNLNDEWVEFLNAADGSVDLSGWLVKDESASHRYTFPSDFQMASGAIVRLHTGCGDDTQDTLFWCNTGSAVWNNGGDTVFLIDPSGNIASSRSYSG